MALLFLGGRGARRRRLQRLARHGQSSEFRHSLRRLLAFKPSMESLEDRRLMAVDTMESMDGVDLALAWQDVWIADDAVFSAATDADTGPRHNSFDAEDVDDDGECSPGDALIIINEINADVSAGSDYFVDVDGDGVRSPGDALAVINRINSERTASAVSGDTTRTRTPTPPVVTEFRSIDGTGNNLAHTEWGSTDERLLRIAAADYADGISSPAGDDRPSAREISNALADHADEDTPNERDLTAYIYVWGQFLDHDLDLTKGASPSELFFVNVPTGDPEFDPNGTSTQVIPLTRSVYDTTTGIDASNPRQQINQITAWIDGSMIYGSDTVRAAALRAGVGGQLKVLTTDVGDLPPLNADNLPIANDAHRVANTQLFLAGDVRSNENIELTSMHTLFVREHNRQAARIAAENPSLNDQAIFQRARSIVIAEIQAITYKEWLPALIGTGAIRSYQGYNANVNPGIANEFSTAAFRLHSSINDDVEFFDNDGLPITFDYTDDYGATLTVEGEIALFDAFFNPTMFKQTGVDGILKYAASTHAEEIDNQLVESLRNFLFGQPGQGGLDLASLNIQRGRDHGLADYNSVRAAVGLPKVTSFAQITSDTEVQAALEETYGSVDNIDLWVGGLAEDHVRGSSMGPLFQRIIADQFTRLRDGDRFWYTRTLSSRDLSMVENSTLADIIERNTGVEGLQNNVFFFRAEVSGQVFSDLDRDGVLDRSDVVLPYVAVQLLDGEGEVIETALTGRDGRYRLSEFPETGEFSVRLVLPTGMTATTATEREAAIPNGDTRIRNANFGLVSVTTPPPPTDGGSTPATPPATGGFNIEIVYSGLTAGQQAIFEQAATKWESLIVGDLPNATLNGRVVDDLLINASAVSIDGRGNVLGQAGADRFRAGSQIPYQGSMQFDTADIAAMQANGTLLGVVMHEIGHVLGIGTLWSAKGLVVGGNTSNPRYVGQQGLAAYNALIGGGAVGVPVENTGGAGTRNSHWRESVFGNELMTGFVGPGSSLPLSRLTAGALADLGYSVNYAAADAFSLPRTTSLATTSTSSTSTSSGVTSASSQEWQSAVDSILGDESESCNLMRLG